MSIQVDVATYLLTKTSITDLVGQRVFVDKIPQGVTTRPVITVTRISNVHRRYMLGEEGHATARVQVDAWGGKDATADSVAEAVRLAMDGQTLVTMNDTNVLGAFLDGDNDTYTGAIDGSDAGEHRVSQDWIVWYNETIPA